MSTINKFAMAALGAAIFVAGTTGNLSAQAATITFERDMNVPGFEPKDQLKISDAFVQS